MYKITINYLRLSATGIQGVYCKVERKCRFNSEVKISQANRWSKASVIKLKEYSGPLYIRFTKFTELTFRISLQHQWWKLIPLKEFSRKLVEQTHANKPIETPQKCKINQILDKKWPVMCRNWAFETNTI